MTVLFTVQEEETMKKLGLTTRQHTEAVGVNLAFGGREVTCGFTGHYSDDGAEVDGTALVGKTSVMFHAVLKMQSPF